MYSELQKERPKREVEILSRVWIYYPHRDVIWHYLLLPIYSAWPSRDTADLATPLLFPLGRALQAPKKGFIYAGADLTSKNDIKSVQMY